jgi:tetratricopeptide (TPR) repeat protein
LSSQSATTDEEPGAPTIGDALSAFQSGRLDEAESRLQAILSHTQSEPRALHLLGVVLRQKGMIPAAIEALERAVKAEGQRASLQGEIGNTYWAAGRLAEAAAAFRRALQLEPKLRPARFALSRILLQQGAHQEAVRELTRVLAEAPEHAYAHLNLGIALGQLGRQKEGLTHLRRAVGLRGQDPVPHIALAVALREDGDRWGAWRQLARAVELGPDLVEAHLEFGYTLAALYRFDEATAAFRRALALQPEMVAVLLALGDSLLRLQQFDEAACCFEKASALDPQLAEPLIGRGHVFLAQGRFDEAEECFTRLRQNAPDLPDGCYGMALCEQHRGRLEEAAAWHERVIAIRPDHSEAHCNLAMVRKFRAGHRASRTIAGLKQLVASQQPTSVDRAALEIALGKIHNDVGDFDAAFHHYKSGNDLRKRQYPTPYDPRSFAIEIDKVISVFTEAFFREMGGIGSESELPVFVVGVTRSGTTLVEQILASHPQVLGRGELDYMRQIVRATPERLGTAEAYPQCLAALTRPVATALADEYLARLGDTPGAILRSVDKRPGNFLRLGLIALLFPRARIIQCVRDPVDTCLSSYFLGNRFAPFANDLAWLGRYYRDYQRVMAHYHAVLPNPILDIPYEALTADQEGWTRKLVDFLGLPWDERCLAFDKTERAVSTPSFWQVRQPIYRSSIGRWRPYRKHLGPLFAALGIAPPRESD